jgi:hypothetical protein
MRRPLIERPAPAQRFAPTGRQDPLVIALTFEPPRTFTVWS